jgi:hypothetical protein
LSSGFASASIAMAQHGIIAASDLSLICATDSVEEAIAHIRNKAIEPFGLKRVARIRDISHGSENAACPNEGAAVS